MRYKIRFKVQEIMESLGLTQTQVAEATGLSMGAVGRVCRNQVNRVDVETIEKLAMYFDCKNINDLMGFDDA